MNYQQDDWLYWLPIAEIAYNNSLHSVINMTPFEAMFGETPKWEDNSLEAKDSEITAARLRAVIMLKQREKLQKLHNEAVNSQAKFYNENHMPKTYKVGEKVLLSTKNIKSSRQSRKLDYKYYGPYEIIDLVGKNADRQRLPSLLKGVHNIFHCLLVRTPYYIYKKRIRRASRNRGRGGRAVGSRENPRE